MLKAVLIDDDQSNLSSLSEKISNHCKEVQIVDRCDNPEDGIRSIDELKPDLVFLDIEMPQMNGFLMLQQLTHKTFELIFVTAYNHYAIKAIRSCALDYLVKPVEIGELKRAVARAEEKRKQPPSSSQLDLLIGHLQKKQIKLLTIPTSDGLQFINIENIIYLEASDNYSNIYLSNDQKFLVSRTLKDFEELLPSDIFIRIHHSTIVNKFYVDKYIRGEGGQVVMRNGNVLDVSKRKKSDFLQAIGY
ncbi:MAG TPA: LytTR family DNA-binding domain-containing protein [Chitinophagaceae bacterium]